MRSQGFRISQDQIARSNRKFREDLDAEYQALGMMLRRRKVEIDEVVKKLRGFQVAIPSWGTVTGGTRFGRFPIPGLPRDIFEKLDDAGTVHQLTGATPRVSLHFPWDKTDDLGGLKKRARSLGLGFDAVNSNTFEDQPGQEWSYKFGSLSHTEPEVRDQAVAHNLEVIGSGKKLGAKAISIWIGDGANFPGQTSFRKSFARYIESLKKIFRGMPKDWRMLIEYKPFEPAFYYTVLADWGSALMASMAVGERCQVLVDLGHHLPGTNVEAIVARLIQAGKLGGFHLNDSQYADDDLTAASIAPYRLFRIFWELVSARAELGGKFQPAYLIDQSHNLKDPIEALIQTTMELQIIRAKALLIDREALSFFQDRNDVLQAEAELKQAFDTDTRPIAGMARMLSGGGISPIELYRESGYRKAKKRERGG